MTHGGFKDLLKNGGFQAFLWTQFLGAFNDNVFKIIVSVFAVHVASEGSTGDLSLAGAVFAAPFFLFSGWSGHLADSVSKRKVLIGVKVFEVAAMLAGIGALLSGRMEALLFVLFLMAVHSTVFSPAKYGIVPEMLPARDLSRANALLEMSTFVAIVTGTAAGTLLFSHWKDAPWRIGVLLTGVAILGWVVSHKITRVPAAASNQPFQWNPFAEVIEGTRHLLRNRAMWLTVLGISYFWFLGAFFQMDLLRFGADVLKADDLHVGLMVTFLAVGIGAGSIVAGKISGDRVELGLVPLGSSLMGLFCIGLYFARGSYAASVTVLMLLGLASGLFIVPLNAYLQERADDREKGRIIATNNIYNTAGLLLASGLLWFLHDKMGLSPDRLILLAGFATLGVTVYIASVTDVFALRFLCWALTHSIFRIQTVGEENVPRRGAALLVSNHMSYVDGFLINASQERIVRFMVLKTIYNLKPLKWFFRKTYAIPVDQQHRRGMVEAIRAARTELANQHIVCIFPEGALTRTGNLGTFKRGMEKIVDGMDVPIIPVHLDRVWGSIFSFERNKFFWKLPKRIPYPVTVSFGAPLPAGATAADARQAVEELGAKAVAYRKTKKDTLGQRLIRQARRGWKKFAMADSSGRELTRGNFLTAAVLFGRAIRRDHAGERMTGVLLPASAAGAIANAGITLSGGIPVNLNFTAGPEAMRSAREQCGIKTVVTSKIFLAKAKLETPEGAVYVEDLLMRAGTWEKLSALLAARLLPARWLTREPRNPDAMATIIFSSGSTGVPKGVMLSHYNIISSTDAMEQVFRITPDDRLVGVLPFFHSFGYSVTLWFPLISGCGALYHPNPTDAKAIGELVAKYRGTLLLSTPTFCATYARKCTREEFSSLRYVLVGAERLRDSVAAAFMERFGIAPMEGYGCTEMSPVVAVNIPDFADPYQTQAGTRAGTVGLPMPGVAVCTVDPNTFAPLPAGTEGLVLVRGENRMLGYLNQPQKTAEVCRDGWYVTGDIGVRDEDGFLKITDRLSRFSKIGGEMVPHVRVEEAITAAIGGASCCVTAVADEARGERLAALYVHDTEPAALWQQLNASELPRLWLPKRENLYRVEALPQLGTGKLDLRAVKALAEELSARSN